VLKNCTIIKHITTNKENKDIKMETFDIGHTSYKIHERQMPTVSKIRMNCI